jgi:D-alanyl-D-alanine carboxypeptidase
MGLGGREHIQHCCRPGARAGRGRLAALLWAVALVALLAGWRAEAGEARHASLVIDANSGSVLHAQAADEPRYPASLTKMMTLYMAFELIDMGRLSPASKIKVSENAAAAAPSKLDLDAGTEIQLIDAMRALVTKSANDMAIAIAEHIGGTEANFARLMTEKARRIGMASTTFHNASGLPDPGQVTTARDMATLALRLQDDFPRHYPLFSLRSFTYKGESHRNHNTLLFSYQGTDGIKTGYTRASGFNLVSSVTDGNRRIVAVVMGGTSGSARDKHMAQLIAKYMPKASSRKGGPLVAKAGSSTFAALADMLPGKQDQPVVSLAEETDAIANEQPTEADQAVLEPVRPKKQLKAAKARGDAQAKREIVDTETAIVEQAYAAPEPRPSVELDSVATATISNSASSEPSGWVIQIASSPSKAEAAKALDAVKNKASALLASASSYTVPFEKGGVIYHRARFGGFDSKTVAMKTCTQLKKKKIACYAVQN